MVRGGLSGSGGAAGTRVDVLWLGEAGTGVPAGQHEALAAALAVP